MPIQLNIVNPSDAVESNKGSYRNQAVRLFNGYVAADWYGRVKILSSGTAASYDIPRNEPQLGKSPNAAFIVPANALITRLAFKPLGALTLGAATGKLKLAPTLTNSTSGLYVASDAASGNTLAKPDDWISAYNGTAGVTVGSSDVTFKLFATDGAAAGSEVASTVTASTDTDVLVVISFIARDVFPPDSGIYKPVTQFTSNNL